MDRSDPDDGPSVLVVDYGLGNLRSVRKALQRVGADVDVSADPAAVAGADGVVLPGVGAFREGVENAGPFREALVDAAREGTPLFGICLGMQMLLTTSEEAERAGQGEVRGLDLIPGENVRFPDGQTVPHMGWNELDVVRDHPLVTGVCDADAPAGDDGGTGDSTSSEDCRPTRGGSVDGEYAYFVHSYYAQPDDRGATVATTDYAVTFPAVVADESGTVFGTQFHPEKSGDAGLRILRNFVDVCARE